jgi:hypothetical protein
MAGVANSQAKHWGKGVSQGAGFWQRFLFACINRANLGDADTAAKCAGRHSWLPIAGSNYRAFGRPVASCCCLLTVHTERLTICLCMHPLSRWSCQEGSQRIHRGGQCLSPLQCRWAAYEGESNQNQARNLEKGLIKIETSTQHLYKDLFT